MKRVYVGIGIVALLLISATAWFLTRPADTDRLCGLVQKAGMNCLSLIADPVTLRPGGIVRELLDPNNKDAIRFALPVAYLDNETCLVPGTKLEPWSPREEQAFRIPNVTYNFDMFSRLGSSLRLPEVQDIQIDAEASASRVSNVSITFGPTRTRLLDENVLLDRIERCEILPRCVDRVRQNSGQIINRVIEVEGLSYSFQDGTGVAIPLGLLMDNKVVRVANASFDVSRREATSLNSTTRMVIAVSTINPNVLSQAKPCSLPVVYSFEGSGRVNVGGGGRPGHIEQRAPSSASLGQVASLTAGGTESRHGNTEITTSTARASATLDQSDAHSLRIRTTLDIQGGHYGKKGIFGGIESGHDTSANADASVDGRINLLVRVPKRRLDVQWNGFPTAATARVREEAEIQVVGPNGNRLETITNVSGSGAKSIELDNEGQYAVVVRSFRRAEGSGWDSKTSTTLDATVKAIVASAETTPALSAPPSNSHR